jgi:hypothetical protein
MSINGSHAITAEHLTKVYLGGKCALNAVDSTMPPCL